MERKLFITGGDELHPTEMHVGTITVIDEPLKKFARENPQFAVIYLSISNMGRIEILLDPARVSEIKAFLLSKILEYLEMDSLDHELIRIYRNLNDDLVLFLPSKILSDQKFNPETVNLFSEALLIYLRQTFRTKFDEEIVSLVGLSIGWSWATTSSEISEERQIIDNIIEAKSRISRLKNREKERLAKKVRNVIRLRRVKIAYQPIINLRNLKIVGYEALARVNFPELANPQVLFQIAEESSQVWDLSRLCRARAIERLGELPKEALLFINFHPEDFYDTNILYGASSEALFKVEAKRIVIELTERSAVRDFVLFKKSWESLKERGFSFAIDDLGSGYSSLELIASLRPDYIKFDISLIRGIAQSSTKQALLRTLAHFSREIGAISVAEGVETKQELDILRGYDCDLVQGFYFARPSQVIVTEIQIETQA